MIRVISRLLAVLALLSIAGVGFLEVRTRRGADEARARLAAYEPPQIQDFGTTSTLSILPLIDWHTSSSDLAGEMGVSYLIETDEHRILFDVGQNTLHESPSPLERNMETLGITLDSIDTLFISHNHFDHVGGRSNQKNQTFSIGLEPAPIPGLRAFVPVPMSYPELEPIHAADPVVIGTGVASTGTIPRQLVFGWIDEQALVVHVAGKGAVLIVGCGHQTISELLKRYDRAFDAPLYGIVGGLHFPVPDGRLKVLGLNAQRIFASGEGMFAPMTMDDVKADLAELQERELGLIGVGGHDSSDEVITMFAQAFRGAYQHVRVGKPIFVGPPD